MQRTGLTFSRIGFGGYRAHDQVDDHRAALEAALHEGCNLVDTSTNYNDGGGERLIGQVLHTSEHLASRDEVVIISKVGYVQGSNLRRVRERSDMGQPFPEVVRYMEGCWHCIHPVWIEDQLERTLERIRLKTVDIYLLHNPEYFLLDAARGDNPAPLEERRTQFYERLGRAFACLEAQVANGRISGYGVSSNTFVVAPQRDDAVSLSRVLDVVEEVCGPNHHFAVAQAPMNLLEIGAAVIRNTGVDGQQRTFLQEGAARGVTILTNRPLNALQNGQLIRLADFDTGASESRPSRLIQAVERLESEFAEGLGRAMDLTSDTGGHDVFRFASRLVTYAKDSDDAVAWDEYVQQTFGPEISQLVNQIDSALSGPMKAAWQIWLERYVAMLGRLVEGLRTRSARASQRRSNRVARGLNPLLPRDLRPWSLSSKSVGAILAVPGVDCVLVGMRQTAYVADVAGILSQIPFEVAPESLRAIGEGMS
ncbi:MAG: aryl-alcohol dehydrogenase-like predicted oxidoreductase [Myxococcota bacterium]|jgi:aryl-alcohol dehydrogenase-like predicted oxidoreductase